MLVGYVLEILGGVKRWGFEASRLNAYVPLVFEFVLDS